ncbi:MAG TPA: chromate resistance protein ChrB domain-containing protein [Candidatus Wujingus californicus]|uniref:chromate resistance protein ChrB domain-containing protein n=1 Tax=Candidatus Wujingus californicus TaxID=3367618 RepID=UPI001D977CFC|nr:chromate resistance protein [Planctomycetota bacterium]
MNKWILFIHQIAQDAPNLRVKVWRTLKKYGALLFKNAVYILPCTKEHEEIMQWLCKQIKDSGSDASLFITESLSREQDEKIIKAFQEVRNKEYLEMFDACNNLLQKIEQIEETDGITGKSSDTLKKKLNEIIKNTEDISRIDFFYSPQKDKVFDKIHFIQQKLNGWQKTSEKEIPDIGKNYKVKDFLGKKWVTRKDIFIDRIASAWLIKRFIDLKAKFAFLSKGEQCKGAIPFDMYGSEFTHRGEDCTFETLMKVFGLKDDALQTISEIVHDIDLKDNKYGRKEAEGIEQIIAGLSQRLMDDNKLLEKGMEIFDALYLSYSSTRE